MNENDYKPEFEESNIIQSKAVCFQKGYTLLELMISLSIVSLLTVAMLTVGFGGSEKVTEAAYHEECEEVLHTILQYQNEAIMDGRERKVRFFEKEMRIGWSEDDGYHQILIPVKTFAFSGGYIGTSGLILYGSGTVSKAGTLKLTSARGTVKQLIVQVGNGRIYLNEP